LKEGNFSIPPCIEDSPFSPTARGVMRFKSDISEMDVCNILKKDVVYSCINIQPRNVLAKTFF
jgi:hypothetical protein